MNAAVLHHFLIDNVIYHVEHKIYTVSRLQIVNEVLCYFC